MSNATHETAPTSATEQPFLWWRGVVEAVGANAGTKAAAELRAKPEFYKQAVPIFFRFPRGGGALRRARCSLPPYQSTQRRIK
jgi:hypothetical protein